jgi:hypothetical protein
MPAQAKEFQEKGENTIRTKVFREFKGVNTKSSRVAIPQDTFYDLTNLMPIGSSNLHSVPGYSTAFDYGADIPYWAQYANINSTDYLYVFTTNGKIFQYNIATGTSAQINAGHLMTGNATRMDQWKNQLVLFIDPTQGYCSWDGTTFTAGITSGIIPTWSSQVDIAVFSGRVWLYSARTLYISVNNSTTDFTLVNGALAQNITDPQARGEATRIFSASGYLYLLFKSGIFVVSDVYIPNGATPPAPVFSILNIQANIGSDQPGSVFVINRDLMFANTYGLWRLSGVTAERVSEDIDGTMQFLNTASKISGGMTKVKNIQNAAFLIQQANDPVFGSRQIVAMYFDQKWWFANYQQNSGITLSFISGAMNGSIPVMFGLTSTNKLVNMFDITVGTPGASLKGPLWPMEDSVSDKEVFRAGFEMTPTTSLPEFQATVDTTAGSTQFAVTGLANGLTWINNANQFVQWINNALAVVAWFNPNYLLYVGDGGGGFSKYVGLSLATTSVGVQFEINSLMMDYTLRKRW